jgi:hypothetical protein
MHFNLKKVLTPEPNRAIIIIETIHSFKGAHKAE